MKKRKILLFLSFIPYIMMVVVLFCSPRYKDSSEIWHILNMLFPAYVWLSILSIMYQIMYFICYVGGKEENSNDSKMATITELDKTDALDVVDKAKKAKLTLKEFIFILCCIVWIAYLGYGIYSMIFGYTFCFFSCSNLIGLDALVTSLVWTGIILSVFPLLPVTLIYIVIYDIYRRVKIKKGTYIGILQKK